MIVAKILRDETRDEHARTEATFAGFDIGTRDGYKCFLIAQASAFLSIERSLEVAGVADVASPSIVATSFAVSVADETRTTSGPTTSSIAREING